MKYHLCHNGSYIHFAMTQLDDFEILSTLHIRPVQRIALDGTGTVDMFSYGKAMWICVVVGRKCGYV